jgi:sec-independent protein translocase protein TatA
MVGLDNPLHLAFLLLIVLLVFGAKRLPEIGRSLGSGLRGFKESINSESREVAVSETTAEPLPELADASQLPDAPAGSAEVIDEPAMRHAA